MGSQRYLVRKVLHAIATLLFVVAFNFYLFRIMPGDPITILARSQHLSRADIAEQIANLGLDKPLPQQLLIYLGDTFRGELGVDLRSGAPVSQLIAERLWPTILLVGISTVLSIGFGLLIGIKGAWQRGGLFDTTSLYTSLVFYSMPEGWLGMILIVLFAGLLGWFPAGQYESPADLTGFAHIVDVLNHLFLPCLTLTLGYIGEYAIVMRSSLLEVRGEDFITTARAKGVPDRDVRRRHAVPNALLPTLTLVFYSFGFVLGGAVVIESVFSWPGVGRLTYEAIGELNYPILQGVFLLSSVTVILFNLAADILYGYLDPRIREG
ncbi:MAG: ABC transporter permease [Actinomycetota bacterium]|nr:MAG: ABC transporter permease [Actinomycetota bacterium]